MRISKNEAPLCSRLDNSTSNAMLLPSTINEGSFSNLSNADKYSTELLEKRRYRINGLSYLIRTPPFAVITTTNVSSYYYHGIYYSAL